MACTKVCMLTDSRQDCLLEDRRRRVPESQADLAWQPHASGPWSYSGFGFLVLGF